MNGLTFKGVIAVIATAITAYVGGWDRAMNLLLILMGADYVFGILAALKRHEVNSDVMFWGGIRKALILVVVGIGLKLDILLGHHEPIIRLAAIYWYMVREGISLIENTGKLGFKWPDFIRQRFVQLSELKSPDQK